ncbi:MAG: hypothetical protein M3Q99_14605 [Acidobacteriota bacterium]|nr:hypothetical protein [Acidobacteriota bacterium]
MPVIIAPPETPLIIDTVIFSHLRNEQPYAQKEISIHFSNTKKLPALSSMTVFEANIGIEEQLTSNNITVEEAEFYRQAINNCVKNYIDTILPFDTKAAEIASYIYPRLLKNEAKELKKRKQKKKNKENRENKIWQDVFIISTALAHNYGLATPDKDVELIAKYLPDNYKYLRVAVWKP